MKNTDFLSPRRILVLDDDKPIRTLLATVLERTGSGVAQAEDLGAARAILESDPIELIICDLSLKGESGLALLVEQAPRSPDIAVIVMTGNDDAKTAIHCLRSGAFDYLLKPFTPEEIVRVVTRVLDRQQKMRAQRQFQMLGQFSSENPNPVLRVSTDGKLLYANQASEAIISELQLGIGDKLPKFLRDLTEQALTVGRSADFELKNADRFYSLTVTLIRDADYVYVYGHDISHLKRAELELTRLKDKAQEQALYDGLTGLPNRTLLDEKFGQELATWERTKSKFAVVFIDLDRFKQINDTQGHKVGDQVLVSVANRLRENVRKTDTVARWGGDEFVLLLPGVTGLADARNVCKKIKNRVQKAIAEKDGFVLTFSMGAAICPDDATDPGQLLQAADAALLVVKTRARNEEALQQKMWVNMGPGKSPSQ